MSLEHAFFYKSVNGDRVYDDLSFEHWLKKFFTSGVFLNDLQVSANNDMNVTVSGGYVNIDGKVKIFESATPLIIETAGASYPRIDSIVLERNDTERDIILKVVKGGYSSEPVAHTPVRQDGVYQLVIAQILVNAGAVKVTQANITDTRNNTELCGIVAGAVDQIDFSQIQAQFDAYFAQFKTQIAKDYELYNDSMADYLDKMEEDFSAWFENIRNQLDEDAAGHLQNQIDDINARLEYAGGSIVEVTVDDNEGEYNVEGLEVNLVIDGKTYTETIPSEKVVKFTGVLEVGKAVITCVDEAQEINVETIINIPYYGAYETSITLSSGGSYEEWIEAGGLNTSSYESLEALLEDEKAVRTLMTKKDSVDVLANVKGADLTTIINNPYVAKWVNYREYAFSTLSAIPEIKSLMDASGMYGMYITVESDGVWQPKGLIPVMTSNTAPYGEAIASAENSNYPTWKAFDGDGTTTAAPSVNGNYYSIGYKFTAPTLVSSISWIWHNANSKGFGDTAVLEASNDGTTWEKLSSSISEAATYDVLESANINNTKFYMYYRVKSSTAIGIKTLQFYGRQLEALIPPMTSNSTPMGGATVSSVFDNSGTYAPYKAFDNNDSSYWATKEGVSYPTYLEYDFNSPKCVKSFSVKAAYFSNTARLKEFKIQAYDGNDWIDLYTGTYENKSYDFVANIDNNNSYSKYRLLVLSSHNNNVVQITSLQFYGTPDYESRYYIYEHGVEVMDIEILDSKGKGEKRVDTLYVGKAGSTAAISTAFFTTNKIPTEQYSIVSINMGSNVAYPNANYPMIGVFGNKSITEPNAIAYIRIFESKDTFPKKSCDISQVAQEGYARISGAESDYFDVSAWWLE